MTREDFNRFTNTAFLFGAVCGFGAAIALFCFGMALYG